VRAQQLTGDPWEEDPGCYLTDAEIGVAPGRSRVRLVPYSRRRERASKKIMATESTENTESLKIDC